MEPPEEVSFQLLREMTDDFSEERRLGEGSFGVVYRGVTHAGEDVAVKMLRPNCGNTGSKQFKNEIHHLAMLRHQNIVQVLGYCYEIEKKSMEHNGKKLFIEEPHRAICLEYLPNKSLGDHLSDEFHGLDWDTRFKIIKGTCEGLKYFLHDLEEHRLCHLDLKPDNILLDKDMSPKIADFGLSRIFGKELKSIIKDPLGTLGYQPPEYIDKGEVSDKFDIFGLGVMMIRIVSGPEGYPRCLYMSLDEFTNQVQKNWRNRLKKQATCNGSSVEMYCHQVKACINIALNCVEKDCQRRPDIVTITKKLNEIETSNCTLSLNGFRKIISRTTRDINTAEMRNEFKGITGQPQNTILMIGPNFIEQEFVDAQETSSDELKELIVGRQKEKEEIMASLLEVISEKIIILPIHGIGGIGKTTFARLIFNDPKFKCYSHVWAYVSQRFDLNKIRSSVVSQLSGEERHVNERQMMQNHLTNLLSHKKILIVLDDLWEEDRFKLNDLHDMFYNEDSNIIILVTTRSERVADRICTNHRPHKILPLTNGMCWDIIKQRSGFKARDDKEQLEDIGLEIAQKCSGVALAAQSLGFTLQSMNINQWREVKDSDIWNSSNDVLPSLKLSYSYMDPYLKICFAYCAIFPKGHKMVKDDLIYQWISLDFIKPTKLLSNIHLCEKHILQLLGLSFLRRYSSSPKTVTMHDLVHDLARSVLVDEILDARKQGNTGESRIHLELLDDCTESLQAFTQYPTNIRGVRFLESDKTMSHSGASSSSAKFKSVQVCGKIGIYDDDVFSSAKDLRVLDLSMCSIWKLPNSIGNLKHLRYLNAPKVQHWVFPYHVMKLSKLTYLSFRGSSTILALPDSIGEMEGLMYLDLSGCSRIKKLPVSFGKLTKLVHLDFSKCSQVTYVSESLKSLTNLKYLDLSYCEKIGELSENLGCLSKLRSLNISNSSYFLIRHSGWSNAEVLAPLTKLEFLDLSTTYATMTNLPEAVNRFTNLKYLNLKGQRWQEGRIAFEILKNLVYLNLSGCSAVHCVLDNLDSLNKLQYLNLSRRKWFADCTDLHSSRMSEAIRNLTELRYLNLSSCSGTKEQAFFVFFLECISNLLNLEHLDLSLNESLTSLPDSFRNLRKLHTLDISYCFNLRDLPSFLSEMDRLMYLKTAGSLLLDMSKQDHLNKTIAVLPNFVVRSDSHDSRSNLSLLNDVNRTDLVISRLENVKSVQEAHNIKLAGKERMKQLELNWTKDVERAVDDMEVLGELVPPTTLERLKIAGYSSVAFPEWVVGITAFHLHNLVEISMSDFPKCNSLPPLGQLSSLRELVLERMNGISEINWDFCGSRRAFPRLKDFTLRGMESLKVWYTTYPGGTDGMSEFMFPELSKLLISDCPNLRLKPCPHRVSWNWQIEGSDGVISSWGKGEGASQISVTTSASVLVPDLTVRGCQVPMHQWRLLHHLPRLSTLDIWECSDLSISPEITRALSSLHTIKLHGNLEQLELPNWLGQLASLEHLTVECHQVKAPHDGFPRLTRLRSLSLYRFESMTTVQQWLGTLVSLQELKIWECEKLNELPESIGCLSSLKSLHISLCDSITSLPESIGWLSSLKSLHISCNSITSLPESIGRLSSLMSLHISSDSITSLPESIGCLTSLEELSISFCRRITCLPETIQQLTKLKRLYIYFCKEIERWCKTVENKAKLAQIEEKRVNGCSF